MPRRRAAEIEAAAELVRVGPVMAGLVARHGPPRFYRPGRQGNRFEALANSIVYQQLAGAAASSIWGRVRALVDGPFSAEALSVLSEAELRGAGLSGAKVASLRDLSARVAGGELRLSRIGRLDDQAVIDHLVTVRGIGPWTAQMFLMFTLARPDVWPIGDLGVRAGYARAYDLGEMPTPAELETLGDRFRPYRSAAAWYCWRAVETITPG